MTEKSRTQMDIIIAGFWAERTHRENTAQVKRCRRYAELLSNMKK